MRARIDLDMDTDAEGLASFLRTLADWLAEEGMMSCPLYWEGVRAGSMEVDERWPRSASTPQAWPSRSRPG